MTRLEMKREELVALFAMKAAAPPPEANKLLVRHLQCKESIRLAGAPSGKSVLPGSGRLADFSLATDC